MTASLLARRVERAVEILDCLAGDLRIGSRGKRCDEYSRAIMAQ